MGARRFWTPSLLREAMAHRNAGLSRAQIAEKMGLTPDAVAWALRRWTQARGPAKAASEWTPEMDQLVRILQVDPVMVTHDALAAIGKPKARRSIIRRRSFLFGPAKERPPGHRRKIPYGTESEGAESLRPAFVQQSNAFAAAMIAAGYAKSEPSRQPGTRNPRIIRDIAEFGAVFDRIPK